MTNRLRLGDDCHRICSESLCKCRCRRHVPGAKACRVLLGPVMATRSADAEQRQRRDRKPAPNGTSAPAKRPIISFPEALRLHPIPMPVTRQPMGTPNFRIPTLSVHRDENLSAASGRFWWQRTSTFSRRNPSHPLRSAARSSLFTTSRTRNRTQPLTSPTYGLNSGGTSRG